MARAKKTKKPTPKPEKISKKEVKPTTAIHWLGISGSIIILLAGFLWLIGNLLLWEMEIFTWFNFGDIGIINIICGLVILITSLTVKKNFLTAGTILLIFSLIALIVPPAGFVVGPALSIIAAIFAFIKAGKP